jgi:hypothetical protein
MNSKFLREAREYTRLFCLEHEIDPDDARSNLEKRLEGKRKRLKELTVQFIENRFPEIDLNG